MTNWRCIKHCGACCHLDPSDRPELADYLSPSELAQYLSMVGEEGWCIHFDRHTRQCQIYEQRPRFCRVQPNTFEKMYNVNVAQFNDFAVDCCHQQIKSVYGKNSLEMQRYRNSVG